MTRTFQTIHMKCPVSRFLPFKNKILTSLVSKVKRFSRSRLFSRIVWLVCRKLNPTCWTKPSTNQMAHSIMNHAHHGSTPLKHCPTLFLLQKTRRPLGIIRVGILPTCNSRKPSPRRKTRSFSSRKKASAKRNRSLLNGVTPVDSRLSVLSRVVFSSSTSEREKTTFFTSQKVTTNTHASRLHRQSKWPGFERRPWPSSLKGRQSLSKS